jgi:hypothetical protein
VTGRVDCRGDGYVVFDNTKSKTSTDFVGTARIPGQGSESSGVVTVAAGGRYVLGITGFSVPGTVFTFTANGELKLTLTTKACTPTKPGKPSASPSKGKFGKPVAAAPGSESSDSKAAQTSSGRPTKVNTDLGEDGAGSVPAGLGLLVLTGAAAGAAVRRR